MNILIELILTLLAVWFTSKYGSQQEQEQIDEEIQKPIDILLCHAEKIHGKIYVWEKETNRFLIQANTMEEIVSFFMKNYPNKKILFTDNPDDQKARA